MGPSLLPWETQIPTPPESKPAQTEPFPPRVVVPLIRPAGMKLPLTQMPRVPRVVEVGIGMGVWVVGLTPLFCPAE
jgi:hypothetical protein